MPHLSPSSPRPAPCAEAALNKSLADGASSRAASRGLVQRCRKRQRGLTLIELVMALMIISVAVTGILLLFGQTVRGSADPLVRKQALAIAESMLNEVLAQPFTYCDPQDAANQAAAPPASNAACTVSQDNGGGALGPRPGTEGRFNPTDPFDNVADYHGYGSNGVIYGMDDGANRIVALDGYSVQVTITRAGGAFGVPADAALRVNVQVTGRGETVTLTGYRFRYAPNSIG